MTFIEDLYTHLPECVARSFRDPAIDHVMLNPDGSVWESRGPRVARVDTYVSPGEREASALAIAADLGLEANGEHPLLEADLPDGSSLTITCPPVCESHAITVRRRVAPGSAPCAVLSLEDALTQLP